MFLLNEIIDYKNNSFRIDQVISFYEPNDNFEFKKGDLVYYDDFEISELIQFFGKLKSTENNYKNFLDFKNIFEKHQSIFDYVNCIGEIKKISYNLVKLKMGSVAKKRYIVDIKFSEDKVLKFSNLKNLKLYKRI